MKVTLIKVKGIKGRIIITGERYDPRKNLRVYDNAGLCKCNIEYTELDNDDVMWTRARNAFREIEGYHGTRADVCEIRDLMRMV